MDEAAVMLPARHKLTVADYDRMVEAGILGKNDHVELIDGEIIDMAPIGQGHEAVVMGLTRALVLACSNRAIVSVQNSVRLDLRSAPQPDFAVFRFRPDFYATGTRPGPADTLLLVEVADTSLTYDRTVKLPLYARAGIPEYWIVDLKGRVLDAYRNPSGTGYDKPIKHRAGERLPLAADPEIVVTLDMVFG